MHEIRDLRAFFSTLFNNLDAQVGRLEEDMGHVRHHFPLA